MSENLLKLLKTAGNDGVPRFYEFGAFRLDAQKRLLWRDDETVLLMPKAFEVLLALVRRHGQVVMKDELMASVWQGSVVEENSLNVHVSALRKVFGEKPHEHLFIVTVPGVGYQFVADVQEGFADAKEVVLREKGAEITIEREFEREPELTATQSTDLTAHSAKAAEPAQANARYAVSRAEYVASRVKRHKKRAILAVATLLVLAVGIIYLSPWIYRTFRTDQQSLQIPIPLTTDPGFEGMPSLSPDGSQVAFASGGPQTDNFDIYVKQIGGGPPRRLTSDPAVDEFPAWSPDGRSIAFIRDRGDNLDVRLIPSLGGPERKIAETAADRSTFIFSLDPPYLSWSADNRYLVTTDRASPGEPPSLFVLSVATGEKRRLTTPPATALGDGNPAVSPDGRTLAFIRVISDGNPQLYVLPLSEDYQSAGEERHLDLSQPSVVSPAWTANGQEIVCFAGQRWGEGRLWRLSLSGSEKPQPLASVGQEDVQPTISRQGNRLVYARWSADEDIWRVEVSGRGRFSPPVKLIASTREETSPKYSPDGSKIVFSSNRSGHSEIWDCNGDGSNPVQLTSMESSAGSPRWFPDGRRVVFDSSKEGHTEVYATDITTLVPRRLTDDSSDNVTPSVSPDGKWIYFSSRRTGRFEVWRLPAEGGEAMQVTRNGGSWPQVSPDSKEVYYLAPEADGVWKVAVGGGQETRVLSPVVDFAVASEGIYFVDVGTRLYIGSTGDSLKFFSFAKGTTEKVADIKLKAGNGLSVSPDGRYVLAGMIDPFVCDLMLVENFR